MHGQIYANSDLSADEHQKLLDIINGLDNSTADSKDAELQSSINNINDRLGNADGDGDTIQQQINNIRIMLGECSIIYNEADGHFYVTYHEGGADSVTKNWTLRSKTQYKHWFLCE